LYRGIIEESPSVYHTHGLAITRGQGALGQQLDVGREQYLVVQRTGDVLGEALQHGKVVIETLCQPTSTVMASLLSSYGA
jgi:hypothetical protein